MGAEELGHPEAAEAAVPEDADHLVVGVEVPAEEGRVPGGGGQRRGAVVLPLVPRVLQVLRLDVGPEQLHELSSAEERRDT